MLLNALAGATIVTPDLDAAIVAYGDFLGYRGSAPAPVGDERAALWGAPQAASAPMAVLYPESGEARFIRLVQGRPAAGYRPMATFGWTALEIVVQDLDGLAARLSASPFEIIGPPAVLDFDFTDKIRAMQVSGPGGEVLYLTQFDGEIPGFQTPDANSFVGQPFIAVLGGRSIASAAAPYARLGRSVVGEFAARIECLSHAHDLPLSLRHALSTIPLEDRTLIEVDAFPASATPRPASSIGLPCAMAMATFSASRLDETPGDLDAVFGVVDGRDSALLRGETGEMIELIEIN